MNEIICNREKCTKQREMENLFAHDRNSSQILSRVSKHQLFVLFKVDLKLKIELNRNFI